MAGQLSVVPGAVPSPLERLVDDYLASCRALGVSRRTLNAYEFPLRRVLVPWARAAGISRVEELDRRTLDRYAGDLHEGNPLTGRSLSRDTVHSYLRPLRQLLRWASAEGEAVKGTPKLPQLKRKLLEVLSLDEIDALEAGAATERDKLIIRLLADTGMRVGELVQLRFDDFRTHDRRHEVLVHGKGDRDRLVPVTPMLFRRVERFATRTRPNDGHSDHLFLSLRRSRRIGVYEPLTVSGVEQLVRIAGEKAQIRNTAERCHPHMLRHSFVTNALRRGMSPLTVKLFAGHTSLRMIDQVYSHLTTADAHDELLRMLARPRP